MQAAVAPTPPLFSSFFFSSVPSWLRCLLTPLWLNSLRASTSLFSSPRHKPPPQPPVFFFSFSSSLVSSSWPFVRQFCLFPRLASSSLQLQDPPHLHQQGPKEGFPGFWREGRLRDLLLLLLLAPPSKQRQHYLRAQDAEKHTPAALCCTACLSVRGRSIEAPCSSSPAIRNRS